MSNIRLTNGKVTLVDDEDYEYLNQWTWYENHSGYATRSISRKIVKKFKAEFMHRAVNKTPEGMSTDHINRNKLDNRKINLRTVTHSMNNYNGKLRIDNTSGYKGVSWSKSKNRWRVDIQENYKQVYIGVFKSIDDAIKARAEYAQKKGIIC